MNTNANMDLEQTGDRRKSNDIKRISEENTY